MGNEAQNIFQSFNFGGGEKEENTLHERAWLSCFIRALYGLNCDFGDKENEHIRDRLVVSIRDKELSRRLQLMSNLTLEAAVQMVRQAEDAAQQMSPQEQQVAFSVQPSERGGRQTADGHGASPLGGQQGGRASSPNQMPSIRI